MSEEIALFGGEPAFEKRIYPTGHAVGEEELREIRRVVESGSLSIYGNHEEVAAFESEFAEFVGVDHAVGVTSGTAALQVALQAAGVEPGEKVIVPSCAFVAVPQAVLGLNAIPRFVDVDPETYCLRPDEVEEKLTDDVAAVVAVHSYGQPAHIERLTEICEVEDVFLVEDAAQACGATIDGQRVGSFGDVACFSFNESKNLTTLGEGGMVVTDDQEIARRAGLIRNAGAQGTDGRSIFEIDRIHAVDAEVVGYNYRMLPVQAAVGRRQLRKLPELNRHRQRLAGLYDEYLADLEFVDHQSSRPGTEHVYCYYVASVEGLPRQGFLKALNAERVMSKPYLIKILPDLELFQERTGFNGSGVPFTLADEPERYDGDYPGARFHARTNFELPMHPSVDADDVEGVVLALERVSARMESVADAA